MQRVGDGVVVFVVMVGVVAVVVIVVMVAVVVGVPFLTTLHLLRRSGPEQWSVVRNKEHR